jgi:hypothetical protein
MPGNTPNLYEQRVLCGEEGVPPNPLCALVVIPAENLISNRVN